MIKGKLLYAYKIENHLYFIDIIDDKYIYLYTCLSYRFELLGCNKTLGNIERKHFKSYFKRNIKFSKNSKYYVGDTSFIKKLKIVYSINSRIFNPNSLYSQRAIKKFLVHDILYSNLIEAIFFENKLIHPFAYRVHKCKIVMNDIYFKFTK
jgi:hypothetical protein